VFVKINGVQHYLWRAVDHDGEVLEAFVSRTRDKAAALTFPKKLMKRHGRPEELVTDKLRSYGAALKELGIQDRTETSSHWSDSTASCSGEALFPLRKRESRQARPPCHPPMQK
jgi:putative transposase